MSNQTHLFDTSGNFSCGHKIQIPGEGCVCNGTDSVPINTEPPSDISAFLYIVVVLSFYGLSMVLLMVKYIKRERDDAVYDHYFLEYVKRDSFNAKTKLLDRRTAKQNILLKYIVGEQKTQTEPANEVSV